MKSARALPQNIASFLAVIEITISLKRNAMMNIIVNGNVLQVTLYKNYYCSNERDFTEYSASHIDIQRQSHSGINHEIL